MCCRALAEMARRRLCWSPPGHMVGVVTDWTLTRLLGGISVASGAAVPALLREHAHSKQLQDPPALQCDPIRCVPTHGDQAPSQVLRCSLGPGCRSQWPDSGSLTAAAPVHCAVAGQGHHLDHTRQHLRTAGSAAGEHGAQDLQPWQWQACMAPAVVRAAKFWEASVLRILVSDRIAWAAEGGAVMCNG